MARRRLCSVARNVAAVEFGIAFDIDGVLIRGNKALPGASRALSRLYRDSSSLRVPFMLFTNGGGYTEEKKASELGNLLDVKLSSHQVFLSHTVFKDQVRWSVTRGAVKSQFVCFLFSFFNFSSFENKRTLAVGKGEPAVVLSSYGFRNVIAMEDYAAEYDCIDPLEQYKTWGRSTRKLTSQPFRKKIEAIFVVSDPVDWGRDIQVICDVLRGGGDPLSLTGKPPPLFLAADDLVYQAAFPVVRFGMGAFRVALESVYNRLTKVQLDFTSYGKPKPIAYNYVNRSLHDLGRLMSPQTLKLKTLYMVGDNPATDIRGAKESGKPWFSILVRTGCFRGSDNDETYQADKVVEDVEEAVDFILNREGIN